MKYFNEIVGLRIYLALWVAIGHGLQLSGYMEGNNALMKFLLNGHAAVVVFMIVSGFVITNLLVVKKEPYLPYITRRFFRLYPMFVLTCIAGYFLIGPWLECVTTVPWQSAVGWPEYKQTIVELYDGVHNQLFYHIISHLTMLHGVVPAEILNRASMTFIPAAWSISLEWQFYLVAPLVLAGIFKRRWLMLSVSSLSLFLLYKAGFFGTFQMDSSLFKNMQYFAIGIASRLAFDRLAMIDIHPLAATLLGCFLSLSLLRDFLPVLVWCAFYSFLVWQNRAPRLGKAFGILFSSKLPVFLGEASYSLYLVHRPIQILLAWLCLGTMAMSPSKMVMIQLLAIIPALALSVLTYLWIERPGIKMGSAVVKILAPKRNSTV